MKKSILLFLVLFLSVEFSFGQDQEAEISVEKKNFIIDLVNLGDGGLVVKTGNDRMNTKKVDWRVHYFTPDLKLKWSKEVAKDQINKGFNNPFVVSPSGNYIYQLEYKGYNTIWGAKKLMINQLDSNGDIKQKEIKTKTIEGDVSAIFCNDHYLYFFTEEKVKRGSDKVLQMRLVKLSHDRLQLETTKLRLPFITDYEANTEWTYLNHNNDNIYLYHKANEGDDEHTYVVAKLNSEGEIEDESIKLSYQLEGKYIRPSHNKKLNKGYSMYVESYPDFVTEQSMNSSQTIYDPTVGAYGGLAMDPDNKLFYVYGLYGNDEAKAVGTKYDGLFVIRYDESGYEDWKLVHPGSAELLGEKYFTTHAVPYSRKLALRSNPFSKDTELQLWFKKSAYTLEVSENGEVKKSEFCEFRDHTTGTDATTCLTSKDHQGIQDYLSEFDKKELEKNYLNHLTLPSGDLLIRGNEDRESYELLLFKD